MKIRKKIANFFLICFITIVLGICVFEIAYRYQWFDFYKAELNGLNTNEELNSSKPKILICGDSFSASPESYVKVLKDSLKNYTVINASVPGSGIIQHCTYIPRRIKHFPPEIFIYQFYVGNDLFDISHPVTSSKLSFTRKMYWWVTDRLVSLSFLNFRLAGVRYQYYDDVKTNERPKHKEAFSIKNYSSREKLNFKAEPGLIENTLYLLNGREKDMQFFEKKFRTMTGKLPGTCKKYFVIIPHQSQISQTYFDHLKELGVEYDHRLYEIISDEYPLYIEIKKLCDELGWQVLDPIQQFRKVDHQVSLYYANDPHLNKDGSFLLGNLLLNRLNQTIQ